MARKNRLTITQIKSSRYVTQGRKLQHLEGGLITRKRLPDGRTLVTIIDEDGRRTETIEEATNGHT